MAMNKVLTIMCEYSCTVTCVEDIDLLLGDIPRQGLVAPNRHFKVHDVMLKEKAPEPKKVGRPKKDKPIHHGAFPPAKPKVRARIKKKAKGKLKRKVVRKRPLARRKPWKGSR